LSQTVTDFASAFCHDAIGAIYLSICHQPKWVLETDISKCFDQIAHQPLLKKLNTSPSIARQIRAWLKAGMIDNFTVKHHKAFHSGCLSPLMANAALHESNSILPALVKVLR